MMDKHKYVQQVAKQLQCSKAKREEVRRELTADILAALESGQETWEAVQERMGSPKAVAGEFNENFPESEKKQYRKKKRTRKVCIVLAVILAALVVLAAVSAFLYRAFPKTNPIEEGGVFDESRLEEQAKTVIGLFDKGEYGQIVAMGDQQFQNSLGNGDSLKQAKDYIGGDWGKLVSYGKAYLAEVEQQGKKGAVVQINAAYEKVSVTYTISFDEDMRLIGFYIR